MRYKYSLRKMILLSLLTCNAVSSTNAEAAQEAAETFHLAGIVVTATATPVSAADNYSDITVITKQDIEKNHYRTIYDVLENVPGVNTRMYGTGVGYELSGYSAPTIRGAAAIVLIDGVNQGMNPAFRGGASEFDMKDIERIEVYKGSASTIYGANAVGGVINIITTRQQTKPETTASYTAGSYGYHAFRVSNQGAEGNSFWYISAAKKNQGNYKDGHGKSHATDLDVQDINFKYGYSVNEFTDVIFKYYANSHDINYTEGYGDYDAPLYGFHDLSALTMIVDYKNKELTEGNQFSIIRGRMDSERHCDGLLPGGKSQTDDTDVTKVAVSNRYFRQLDARHRISTGYDYSTYKAVGSSRLSESAVYLQDEFQINKKLKFTAGVRRTMPKEYEYNTSKSFNLGYKVNSRLNLFANSADFYVPPSEGQVFGNYLYIPNYDLKPASGKTNEIGFNFTVDKNTQITVDVFRRNETNGFTYKNVADGMRQYINTANENIYNGFEFNMAKKFDKNLSVDLGYFRMWSGHNPIVVSTPADIVTLGVAYRQARYDVGLKGIGRYDICRPSSIPAGVKFLPEETFWVWNLSANYQASQDTKVFAKVNNLFNEYYMPVSWYNSTTGVMADVSAKGRNFLLGVEYSF